MSRPARPLTTGALALAASLALAGCGGSASGGSAGGDEGGGGTVRVVASTDVWGDVAASVGGDGVEVTSVIDDPSQDPHSYEATARDQLAVKDADVVVENGGGYDPFMEQLVDASGTAAPVVDAVEVSGLQDADEHEGHSDGEATEGADEHAEDSAEEAEHSDDHGEDSAEHAHDHGAFNEHVWYDLPTAAKVAQAVATALGQVDPDNAATYEANAKAFADGLTPLQQEVSDVATRAQGAGVAVTEPVPDHLLESMGLTVTTPEAFTAAVEEGTDVSPAVLADTEAQFADGTATALVYNEQTTGAETEAVREAAQAAGVPVVPMTETLPEGQDYTQWMTANVAAVRGALGL